jgi:hypothetical protein
MEYEMIVKHGIKQWVPKKKIDSSIVDPLNADLESDDRGGDAWDRVVARSKARGVFSWSLAAWAVLGILTILSGWSWGSIREDQDLWRKKMKDKWSEYHKETMKTPGGTKEDQAAMVLVGGEVFGKSYSLHSVSETPTRLNGPSQNKTSEADLNVSPEELMERQRSSQRWEGHLHELVFEAKQYLRWIQDADNRIATLKVGMMSLVIGWVLTTLAFLIGSRMTWYISLLPILVGIIELFRGW